MKAARTIGAVGHIPRGVGAAALGVTLVASAYVMTLAVASPGCAWLGWLTLLPLFFAIRVSRSLGAALSGAVWGLSLFVFSVAGTGLSVEPSIGALALLTAIPALYAYFGARLTRWIGFSPLVLGVSWMGVELAFEPLGLHHGLLAGTQAGGTLIHWIGGALGYVLVAFLVAYVSASLLSVLSHVRVAIPRPHPAAGPADDGTRLLPQTFSCFPLFAIPASRPRAPPIETVAMG